MAREFHYSRADAGDIYTGTEYEADLLDVIKVRSPEYKKAFYELGGRGDPEDGYMSFEAAVKLVKEFQPSDPTNSKRDFLRELRLEVLDLLGIEDEKEQDKVKTYTALRTPLDKKHRVDAFMEVEGKNGEITRATLDVSLDPNKLEKKPTANVVVIGEIPDPTEGGKTENEYLKIIGEIAKEVVKSLRSEIRYQGLVRVGA